MIYSRDNYSFIGGDINDVIIDGGIMPLRSQETKRILRGEDICFLLEGLMERLSWWKSKKEFNGNESTSLLETTNSKSYWATYSEWNKYPFYRKLAKGYSGSVFDVNHRIDYDLTSYSSIDSPNRFYPSSPITVALSPSLDWDNVQPSLTKVSTQWISSNPIRSVSDMNGLFTDLDNPKYASVMIRTDDLDDDVKVDEDSQSGSTFESLGNIGGYYADEVKQYNSHCSSKKIATITLGCTKNGSSICKQSSIKVFALLKIWFDSFKTDVSGSITEYKYKIIDITSLTQSSLSSNVYSVYSPVIDKSFIISLMNEDNCSIYTRQDFLSAWGVCVCEVSIDKLYVISELNPLTVWS